MPTARLNGELIADWDSFHDECAKVFGFPDFYGRNMNAWVDCLSYLRDDDGMSKFVLKDNEVLTIEVQHSEKLRATAPDILEELQFCVAMINERCADYEEAATLRLALQ
ncbi:barstar family protein [Herbaspirillum sp. RV1423]|uniref:barstar family protein n=1 Tax=Herbaspirillum sp. RV1423 TaxID=1443993 RepID=UPI0004BC24BC|nr:barstar family protein [Herbaspirillum sp. RV1423]